MFRGVNPINLDAKGRMAMPSRYRESIAAYCAGQMVATIDAQSPCLLLYPLPDWEEIQAKIDALPSFNAAAVRLKRLLIGHATDIELDGSGRMLLPSPLRDYASLDKRVVLLGQGRKFEIWSEELWNQTRDDYLKEVGSPDTIPDEMLSLSL
ncbi:division/cell wall cluster transcriptional repressor MraZ [Nitrincola alkalilacustris]|uniref:division/cell wall cluster transcriptional repressor MraZ n=1 Tax=Nitrincola alkalilacustris TaxID=1571224 RepID=UPI00124F72F3|nr:division/cell wall cluster transcriptional repressor MraZ [Nitrincola alkalilacustris]